MLPLRKYRQTELRFLFGDNTDFPLQFKMVKNDSRVTNLVDGISKDPVEYKMYYLILNQGGGTNKATNVDSTFVSYRGWKLDNDEFDRNDTPFWSSYPALTTAEISLISGFRQFIPLLNPAESTVDNGDGTTSFVNAGVGVVFIPSGLGYYNTSRTGIPAYSPLVFTVRLDKVKYRDHDNDGIWSKNEDLNHNGDNFDDDTDGDNVPDFLDGDDDGDHTLTKFEIVNGQGVRYPFEAFDQIPDCQGNTTGLKKHLDPSCH